MKRNELWLGGLLAVAGFFGACTNVVEDESLLLSLYTNKEDRYF